ncbi:ammonium transporter, partial [Rhodococcus pyridinivorans]|nr:ammonium transporter [Rhodococcus pyridinivorans]
AQQNFASQLGIATAVGGLAGTIIGAVVGGLGLLGGPVGLASIPLGAGIGGVIGTIVAGGPTLIVAGIGLIQTLTAPPGTTVYAN